MKKFVYAFVLVTLPMLISCNWEDDCPFGYEICSNCRMPINECRCVFGVYGNDYFSVGTLVGEWQMVGYHDNEYMNGCGIIPHGIIFATQEIGQFGKCTMTYSIRNDPQWYTIDLYYNYVRREITFYTINGHSNNLEKFISFTYKSFLFPSLIVKDSFGIYEWRKVRVATPK